MRRIQNFYNYSKLYEVSYLHSAAGLLHDINTFNNPIDLREIFDLNDFSKENKEKINNFLKRNKEKFVSLYHGTSPKHNIIEDGLLKTTNKTKKSFQSEVGYVYLSVYPSSAKTFGDLAYGISNAVVYEIKVPIEFLKVDTDQLKNKRLYGSFKNIENTLADSLLYGNGFRVKGNIPPYLIKKL